MATTEVLFHSDYLMALLLHAISAPLILLATLWLSSLAHASIGHEAWAKELNHWGTQHVWLPLARIAAILLFIVAAFPVIYGLDSDIAIGDILHSERIDTLINTLFVISLLLPLIPVVGRIHALVLPLQSLAAAQLLFNWLNQHAYQQDISLLPSLSAWLQTILLVIASHGISLWLAKHIGLWLDDQFNVEGFDELLLQSILLILQAPLLLIYTVELGRQLNL